MKIEDILPERLNNQCAAASSAAVTKRGDHLKRMTPVGRFLRASGAVRVFKDGDGLSVVWRWWHPLSWLAVIVLLPVCGVVGERIGDQVPFRLSQYWRERRGSIQWL